MDYRKTSRPSTDTALWSTDAATPTHPPQGEVKVMATPPHQPQGEVKVKLEPMEWAEDSGKLAAGGDSLKLYLSFIVSKLMCRKPFIESRMLRRKRYGPFQSKTNLYQQNHIISNKRQQDI